jgi:hypothetical protein
LSEHRSIVYAVDLKLLSGVAPNGRPDGDYLAWHATLPATPAFTLDEMRHLFTHGRVVPHHTYSMQQSEFDRAGFAVTKHPWTVRLPPRTLVVGIGEDGEHRIITYENVDEWRAARETENIERTT